VYARLLERLGPVTELLRTHRFAEEDLARTKTDAIDALGLARFGAQKHPPAIRSPDAGTDERSWADWETAWSRPPATTSSRATSKVWTRELATTIPQESPTAQAFRRVLVQAPGPALL
jgi:hypothetical protein